MAGSLTLDLRIPSDLQQIEGVVEEVLRGCAARAVDVGALGSRFKVALCEALSNAIICGNGEDARKEVRVRVEVRDDVVIVEVEDEGRGSISMPARKIARRPRTSSARTGAACSSCARWSNASRTSASVARRRATWCG